MKTGTLTWHFLNNYGSVLQAYALQKIINGLSGDNNQIINYYDKTHTSLLISLVSILRKKGFFKTSVSCLKFIFRSLHNDTSEIIDTQYFNSFRTQYLTISPDKYGSTKDLRNSLLNYDTYIVGSDNVWIVDPKTGSPRGLSNPHYFLDFVPSTKKRISYAASMGDPFVENSGLNNFTSLFNNLDYISVREKETAEFLSSSMHREVAWVVDPTLLLTADDWDVVTQESGLYLRSDTYILVYVIYALNDNSPIFKYARYMGQLLHKEIIYLGYHMNDGKSTNTYVNVPDFLYYIKNASLIITNSFHGTVFSIIYRKSFVAFPPREGACRITDLLESFHLSERYVSSFESAKQLNIKVDYINSETDIENRRIYSLNWLSNVLTNNVSGENYENSN